MAITKTELKQIIREVLREELNKKNSLQEDSRHAIDYEALYATLDDAFSGGKNVVIRSRLGMALLAHIRKWCDGSGLPCVIVSAKDTELFDAMLGYGDDLLASTYNRQLNNIDGSVLVIDEFDRVRPQDRAGLLTEISEHTHGQLFTVAVVNSDIMNAAEKARFPLQFEVV